MNTRKKSERAGKKAILFNNFEKASFIMGTSFQTGKQEICRCHRHRRSQNVSALTFAYPESLRA